MDCKDTWTLLQTKKLIQAYQRFPNMWDINHKYYRNKSLRLNCLRHLAKEVSEVKPGTKIAQVRAKLKTLRSQFGKEKRRRAEAQENHFMYKPTLWCYDDLKFIDPDVNDVKQEIFISDERLDELLADPGKDYIPKKDRVIKYESWNKGETLILLQHLKDHPLIYDSQHPLYQHHLHRAKSFRELLLKIRPHKINLSVTELRQKIKTLRCQYQRENRLMRQSFERYGKVRYVPKLWCYEHLKIFDKKKDNPLDYILTPSTPQEEDDFQVGEQPDDCYVEENENEIYVKSYDESDGDEHVIMPIVPSASETKEQIPRSVLHEKCLSLVESLSRQITMEQESNSTHPQNGDNLKTPQAMLGKMVELELSKVSSDIFEDTKWQIIKLLEEASKRSKKSGFIRH